MGGSKDDPKDRLTRYRQIKISVIGRVVLQGFVSPRKSLTRHWLLCRDHRFQFRLRWNDDPCEQVRDDALTWDLDSPTCLSAFDRFGSHPVNPQPRAAVQRYQTLAARKVECTDFQLEGQTVEGVIP